MALFGGQRDMALFSKINKELITDIIDTEVYYYKVIVEDTKQKYPMSEILYEGTLDTHLYNRFMLIGRK